MYLRRSILALITIHVDGHGMFGYGCDPETAAILLHDMWSQGQHGMTWGGACHRMDQLGVTVLEVLPDPATTVLLVLGTQTLPRRRRLLEKCIH